MEDINNWDEEKRRKFLELAERMERRHKTIMTEHAWRKKLTEAAMLKVKEIGLQYFPQINELSSECSDRLDCNIWRSLDDFFCEWANILYKEEKENQS
jgi:hypothetical protein